MSGSESLAAYYPIRVVSAETGINAITLRAWERRYGLIEPKRTAKGHRLYTEQDIRLIKRVVALLNRGIPISQAQAMLSEEQADTEPLMPSPGSSQWQHYRESLYDAVQTFDDVSLIQTWEEIGQSFPLEMALRFLFIPLYHQLNDALQRDNGQARLSYYCAFLESRLAWKLSERNEPGILRLLVANTTNNSEINLLLLAVLLGRMEVGSTRLGGLCTIESIQKLVCSLRKWPAILLQIEEQPVAEKLRQLRQLAIETGGPVFVCGNHPDLDASLREHGLVPVGQDTQQAALNVRDIVQETRR